MDSSSYLLISVAVGSLLLLAGGVLWVVASQFAPPSDDLGPRPVRSIGRLVALIFAWMSSIGQFLAAFILLDLRADGFGYKDVLAFVLLLGAIATLVITAIATLRWTRSNEADENVEPSLRRRPLLIAYSTVVGLVVIIYGTMFWVLSLSHRAFLNEDAFACLMVTIAAHLVGWIGMAYGETRSASRSVVPTPLYRDPRALLRLVAITLFIWGVIFWSWLGIIPGIIWLLVIWTSLAARSRAGELTAMWTLSISSQSGSPKGPQIWQHMSRVQGPAQKRLKRLAAVLGEGEPLDLALQRCRVIPRSCSMEIQAALDADRLSEALRAAATRETKRFAQGPEVTEAFSVSYFAVIINVMILITGFLMYYIIPKFKKIFEDFGTELPEITKLLIHTSDAFVNYWYLFIPVLIPATYLAVWCDMQARFHGWRAVFERMFGSYWPRLRSPDLLRGLAWGIRGGRPLAETFAAMTLGQATPTIRQRVRRIAEQVRNGEDPWKVLVQHGWLNAAECEALQRAQPVGNLPWVLEALADADEQRWEHRMLYRLQFVRPVLITLLGLAVAFIVIAMFMPLVKLLNDLS